MDPEKGQFFLTLLRSQINTINVAGALKTADESLRGGSV